MSKLFADHKFPGLIGPVWLEEKLEPFGLGLYAKFIAFAQLAIGYFLITWSYRKIFSIALLIMLINILVVTISLQWRGTPFVLSIFIIQLLSVMWVDRNDFMHLVLPKSQEVRGISLGLWSHILLWGGFLMILFSIVLSEKSLTAAWVTSGFGVLMGAVSPFVRSNSGN